MDAPLAHEPDPLPATVFDAHTHLDMLSEPVEHVMAQAARAGVAHVITVGTDLDSSRWASACARQRADVSAAVAIHPNETARAEAGPGARGVRDKVLAEIAELAALPH